jgi:hypothetical protein
MIAVLVASIAFGMRCGIHNVLTCARKHPDIAYDFFSQDLTQRHVFIGGINRCHHEYRRKFRLLRAFQEMRGDITTGRNRSVVLSPDIYVATQRWEYVGFFFNQG